MSWDWAKVSTALAGILEAAAGEMVSVFASPPATFNPPALIVQYPQTVALRVPTFSIDNASWSVLAAVGIDQGDLLDQLLGVAATAVEANVSLADTVQMARPVEYRSYRILNVAGSNYLAAELAIETRM